MNIEAIRKAAEVEDISAIRELLDPTAVLELCRLAEIGGRMQWQPIETAPKDGSEFLTSNARQGRVLQLVKWNRIHGFWQSKGEAIHMQATHWMPLSKPPK